MTPAAFTIALLAIVACPSLATAAYLLRRKLPGCAVVAFIVAMFGMTVIGFIDAVEYLQACLWMPQ